MSAIDNVSHWPVPLINPAWVNLCHLIPHHLIPNLPTCTAYLQWKQECCTPMEHMWPQTMPSSLRVCVACACQSLRQNACMLAWLQHSNKQNSATFCSDLKSDNHPMFKSTPWVRSCQVCSCNGTAYNAMLKMQCLQCNAGANSNQD